jgi:hypothetical protein
MCYRAYSKHRFKMARLVSLNSVLTWHLDAKSCYLLPTITLLQCIVKNRSWRNPTFFTCSKILHVFGMLPPPTPPNRMLKTVAISAIRNNHRLHDDRITLPYNKTYVLTIPRDVRRKTFILICQPENFRISM